MCSSPSRRPIITARRLIPDEPPSITAKAAHQIVLSRVMAQRSKNASIRQAGKALWNEDGPNGSPAGTGPDSQLDDTEYSWRLEAAMSTFRGACVKADY